MEKDKSRGFKHLQDKKKYKPKPKSNSTTVVTKSKPIKLDSNWDRYDEEDNDNFELESKTNFSILASNPIIKGSHFQFKRDKLEIFGLNEEEKNIFNLDINILNLSLTTLPFFEFIGYQIQFSVSIIVCIYYTLYRVSKKGVSTLFVHLL
ncbi:unnamed protein product [Brassicogethes aeneus]|uniref:Uncharacterized protein n=1 Tax=Brassicogethes aeneus TaxID=1431903 RepID=A0A9P0BCI8_BRAAE|nr:unnamed protein product [Brassicogethes aeneus]